MSPRNDLEEALLALGKTMGMDSETIDRVGVPFLLGAAVERLRQINRMPGEWFEDFDRLRRDRDELRHELKAARIPVRMGGYCVHAGCSASPVNGTVYCAEHRDDADGAPF